MHVDLITEMTISSLNSDSSLTLVTSYLSEQCDAPQPPVGSFMNVKASGLNDPKSLAHRSVS